MTVESIYYLDVTFELYFFTVFTQRLSKPSHERSHAMQSCEEYVLVQSMCESI